MPADIIAFFKSTGSLQGFQKKSAAEKEKGLARPQMQKKSQAAPKKGRKSAVVVTTVEVLGAGDPPTEPADTVNGEDRADVEEPDVVNTGRKNRVVGGRAPKDTVVLLPTVEMPATAETVPEAAPEAVPVPQVEVLAESPDSDPDFQPATRRKPRFTPRKAAGPAQVVYTPVIYRPTEN